MPSTTAEVIQVEATRSRLQERLAHHRDRQALHAEEVRRLEGLLTALQNLAEFDLGGVVEGTAPYRPAATASDAPMRAPQPDAKGDAATTGSNGRGKRGSALTIQAAVSQVVALWNDWETLTAPTVTQILNDAYKAELGAEVGQKQVSTVLRRMEGNELRRIRDGGPRKATVYAKPAYEQSGEHPSAVLKEEQKD